LSEDNDKEKKIAKIITEGVNFDAVFTNPLCGLIIDMNKVTSNSIFDMLKTYGVECCRTSIINEIQAVFKPYSINVDRRHLSLISDWMTFGGGFTPFNRRGLSNANPSELLPPFAHSNEPLSCIKYSPKKAEELVFRSLAPYFYSVSPSVTSPLMHMSFETSTGFLMQNVVGGYRDGLFSPSAALVTGQPPLVGTGCVSLLYNVSKSLDLQREVEERMLTNQYKNDVDLKIEEGLDELKYDEEVDMKNSQHLVFNENEEE
jgi:DNA-directed RNA polymerase I subunit RPA1